MVGLINNQKLSIYKHSQFKNIKVEKMRPSQHKKILVLNSEATGKGGHLKKGSLTKVAHHTRFKDQQQNSENKINEVQNASLKIKYDRAMEMVKEGDQSEKQAALKILHDLCQEIRRLSKDHVFSIPLLENIFKNYLGLKSMIGNAEQVSTKEELNLIRYFTNFFEETYERKYQENSVNKESLSLFFLIQANQEYHLKKLVQALSSCDKSKNYCSGTKTQIDTHLMKVHFLKSSLYRLLKDQENQFQEIKNCLDIINRLLGIISDQQTKDYILNLKNILVERKKEINQKDQPILGNQPKKISINKFRKRSISLKKSSSQKQIGQTKPVQKTPRVSHHSRKQQRQGSLTFNKSLNHSKYLSVNFQNKKESGPQKQKVKLQKKPQLKKQLYTEVNKFMIDEIQNQRPKSTMIEDFMLARPETKKPGQKEEIRNSGSCDEFESFPVQQMLTVKKESEEAKSSRIEPITHGYGNTYNDFEEEIDNDLDALIENCIEEEQEKVIEKFIKINFPEEKIESRLFQPEKYKKSTEESKSEENLEIKIQDNLDQSDFCEQKSEQMSKIVNNSRKIPSMKNHQQIVSFKLQRQLYSYGNNDFDIDQSVILCTSFGCFSRINLKLKVLEGKQNEQNQEQHRTVLVQFSAWFKQYSFVVFQLKYNLIDIFESDLYAILYELNRHILPSVEDIPDQISNRVFTLISNQIIPHRKAIGKVIIPKTDKQNIPIDSLKESYKQELRDRFMIYELNKLTQECFSKQQLLSTFGIVSMENIKDEGRISKEDVKEQLKGTNRVTFNSECAQEQAEEGDVISEYVTNLTKKFHEDKEQGSSLSSLKRFKTQKLKKYTMMSYKSTLRSIDIGQFNLCIKEDDNRSLNVAIMPSEFHFKISRYFQQSKDAKDKVPFEQFYYCMKFVLIKPSNKVNMEFLNCFYRQLSVQCFQFIKGNRKVKIEMTAFKPKQIFRLDSQMFFKFQLQFMSEKIKQIKFIATSKDIKLIEKVKKNEDGGMRTSRRPIRPRVVSMSEEDTDKYFTRDSLLSLLKNLAGNIFVKKGYIYSVVGFENRYNHLNYINKFRLEGRTVQGKNFMTSHLKQIQIIFQKSIMIKCQCFKGFSVLTVRQIINSNLFNLVFYIPKLQRSESVSLTRGFLSYFSPQQLFFIFQEQNPNLQEMQLKLFALHQSSGLKLFQRQAWNRLVSLFKFQSCCMDGRMELILRIGNYCSFLKDLSFSQYFQMENKLYQIEMSLSKKLTPKSIEIKEKKKQKKAFYGKRKSNSSKELPKNRFEMKRTEHAAATRKNIDQIEYSNEQEEQSKIFKRLEFIEQFNQIYESDVNKYVLYITLTLTYEIKQQFEEQDSEPYQSKKVNFSFYLSDLCQLIKKTKEQLATNDQPKIDFSQEYFSFALLLRTMTVIKHRLIKLLKIQSDKKQGFIDELFKGDKIMENQKRFRNKLDEVFQSKNHNFCTLNVAKKFYKLENNVFMVYKGIIDFKVNQLVCFIYNKKQATMTAYLVSNKSLESRHKVMQVNNMTFPWVTFLSNTDLLTVNQRLYHYYRNILLLA